MKEKVKTLWREGCFLGVCVWIMAECRMKKWRRLDHSKKEIVLVLLRFDSFLLVHCISLHLSREEIFRILSFALPGCCTAPSTESSCPRLCSTQAPKRFLHLAACWLTFPLSIRSLQSRNWPVEFHSLCLGSVDIWLLVWYSAVLERQTLV